MPKSRKKIKTKQNAAPAKTGKKQQYIISLLIIVFCFVLYGNTINNDYSLDDNFNTFENIHVQKGIKGIPGIFSSRYCTGENQTYGYRPVAQTSFALEHQFFGLNPHVSHFFNVLIW